MQQEQKKELMDDFILKQIKLYNNKLIKQASENTDLGVKHGKLGICIYFYIQNKIFNDKIYEDKAENLLKSILSNINYIKDYNLTRGITGIGFGILYLLKSGLCEGNPNIVLKDIDDTIFKALCDSIMNNKNDIHEDIFKCIYLCVRIKNSQISKIEKEMFEEILKRSFNKIYSFIPYIINSEPQIFSPFDYSLLMFMYLTIRMKELNLYEKKINRMLQEWLPQINSIRPISKGHQYLLYKMIEEIQDIHQNTENNTLNEDFFFHEMKNMSLSFATGVSGLWLFMNIANLKDTKISELIIDKIRLSEIWIRFNDIESILTSDSLFTGLPGIILTYQKLAHNV